nr:d-tyrosyl-trna(tyr) deacylase [Quercus suber]
MKCVRKLSAGSVDDLGDATSARWCDSRGRTSSDPEWAAWPMSGIVIQRVKSASVTVDGQLISTISKGLLVFAAIGKDDTEKEVESMASKVLKIKLWDDDQGGRWKMNVQDISGEVLCGMVYSSPAAIDSLMLQQFRNLPCLLPPKREVNRTSIEPPLQPKGRCCMTHSSAGYALFIVETRSRTVFSKQ